MVEAYRKFQDYLELVSYRGIRPGLDRISEALCYLDFPQKKLRVIHIAGTNGKGSVCHLLTQLLAVSGYSVGLNVSPHIVDYRERIQLFEPTREDSRGTKSGIPRYITEKELVNTHAFIQSRLPGTLELTYFEYTTLLALVFFAQKKVDFAILETGMGGRWDATNVCDSLISGITSISLDHTEILGDTIEKILTEKLKIIKPGVHFLFGPDDENLVNEARAHCERKGARFHSVREFAKEMDPDHLRAVQALDMPDGFKKNLLYVLALAGLMKNLGHEIRIEDLLRLPKKYFPPARYEKVSEEPVVLIDGAHNQAGLENLGRYWREKKGASYDLYFGCLTDRNPESLVEPVLPDDGRIYWIIFEGGPRSPSQNHYHGVQKKFGGEIVDCTPDLKKKLVSGTNAKLVCGSLYLCARVRSFFR